MPRPVCETPRWQFIAGSRFEPMQDSSDECVTPHTRLVCKCVVTHQQKTPWDPKMIPGQKGLQNQPSHGAGRMAEK